MSEYITLLGSENVERAGSCMSGAAAEMQRAASTVSCAIEQMGHIVDRFEASANRLADTIERYVEYQRSREVTVSGAQVEHRTHVVIQHIQPCACAVCESMRGGA
jgi:hypothetical protein